MRRIAFFSIIRCSNADDMGTTTEENVVCDSTYWGVSGNTYGCRNEYCNSR